MPTTSPPARVKLLDKTEAGARPVRLLGVSVHNFGDADAECRRNQTPGCRFQKQ